MSEPYNRLIHLKQHISHAADELARSSNTDDGLGSLIYLGNHHDSVPRELIIDPHLESGEFHTWLLMKIQFTDPAAATSIPSQNQLAQYLKCSRPVVSRHLQVLRALRWITLCETVRGSNGQFKGCVYAQHDKPLSLADTLFLDSTYIKFLESPNKADSFRRLRSVKQAVLLHMDYQVVTDTAFVTPTALEAATSHLSNEDRTALQTNRACPEQRIEDISDEVYFEPDIIIGQKSNETEKHRVKVMHRVNNINTVKKAKNNHVNIINMDESPSQRDSNRVNNINTVENNDRVNFNMDRVKVNTDGSSSILNITTTTTTKQQIEKLRFPKVLEKSPRQKLYAAKVIDPLPLEKQQYALDYLSDKLKAATQGTSPPVNDVIGYLNWIVKNIITDTLPPSSYGIKEPVSNNTPKEWEAPKATLEEIKRNHKQGLQKIKELKQKMLI